ncbi:hypothetical protein EC957_003061 [Mortierella hygrophila]|uniref:Uncharacterized protein n=1 Tax=Mortierella hygrophila TaxID=979708 RepID=A0A9P6F2K1_9FUNG|nr:hypothetical protein EC957_003061 [Mortierella hygrophila]
MIHTSPNGFESGLIRSAITSSVVTATVTATNTTAATATAAATTTAAGSTITTDSTTLTTASPTELRLKNRLQRIIRIPPSVAQTHSNKATASTSTHTPPSSATSPNTTTTSPTTNTTTSPTATTPKHRGGHSRVEKKQLFGATVAISQDKPLVTTTTVTSRLLGSGTDLSAPPSTPSPAPAAPTPVSDSYPDSYLSEKNPETIKVVDQHHLHNPYYYSPDPMSQRQVYTVGSSLLAKAKVKARALQHNLLSPQQLQQHQQHSIQHQQHQQNQHGLDPLTKLELHKGNQEEGADGRRSSSDGTDVESNASNSNTNTISVGTSNHLKSIHYQHHHLHHRSSSAQLDNTIMGDSDPQSDNSHDHSNDSDSTVTDHPPHEALLSPPTPRSRKCSLRSRNSIGPDEEKLSSVCIAVAGGEGGGAASALLTTTPAVLPRPLSKETAAGVEEKDDEDNAVVFVEEKKADTVGEALLSDSPEPTMLMTTQDSAALYEAIFQRQHLTEESIAGSLHELRQLILAYGIPEQL